jgi:hypothetical protein
MHMNNDDVTWVLDRSHEKRASSGSFASILEDSLSGVKDILDSSRHSPSAWQKGITYQFADASYLEKSIVHGCGLDSSAPKPFVPGAGEAS